MNIEINLLPEELRPKPIVEGNTLLVIVVVVALVAGCVYLFQAKSGVDAEIADLEASIVATNKEIQTVSSNAEAVALKQSIDRLKSATNDYQGFLDSRVLWGDCLAEIEDYVPQGVRLVELSQEGTSTLLIGGVASQYSDIDSYFSVLDRDDTFSAPIGPAFNGSTFTLYVEVASGGGQ
jgi:Tfp pilus assembly protein PilN